MELLNSNKSTLDGQMVRPVSELPSRYRPIFNFVSFNHVQSVAFESMINTDKQVVVSAPTGSGKTGILELAILKVIMDCDRNNLNINDSKVVYIAPTKALCNERKEDWSSKFQYLNVQCLELTSDNPGALMNRSIQRASILLATPEKWDSITRNFFSHRTMLSSIRLMLIDEVHLINDGQRGATLEAVISRMKTIRSILWPDHQENLRFVAISATVSNIQDIGEWLSTSKEPAEVIQIDENKRPVKLKTFVFGYSCANEPNEFAFDHRLNPKLPQIIKEYSNLKPTLIFCATRKSCVSTANFLAKEGKLDISFSHEKRRVYINVSMKCTDKNLQETLRFGIAYHHAGLSISDRRLIEQAFTDGKIMILCSTSTLAMGVNLPAHLVIIKNTNYFSGNKFVPYSESSLIQMIGRAGRPQFDSEATAVIMTRATSRDSIQQMLNGNLVVESQLHKFLVEHINSEIVLGTIKEDVVARKWIDSTYLKVRLMKYPEYYGLKKGCTAKIKEEALINWLSQSVNKLLEYELVLRNKQQQLESTDSGRAMARHYICLETMTKITKLRGDESLYNLLEIIASTYEILNDIQLRAEEKSALNSLNSADEIRFYIGDKIDTREKKALVLIQTILGNINVTDTMLFQESNRIVRNAERVTSCLREVILLKNSVSYSLTINTLILSLCLTAKLWENSIYVTKQLDKIGSVLSHNLAKSGMTSFEAIRKANPRNLEIFCNRLPPFGSNVQQTCFGLPIYDLNIRLRSLEYDQTKICILVDVILKNGMDLRHVKTLDSRHECILVVGSASNNRVFFKNYVSDMHLLTRPDLTQTFGSDIDKIYLPNEMDVIEAQLISTMYIGLNVRKEICYIEPSTDTFHSTIL